MEQIKKRAVLITGTIVPNSNFVAHQNIDKRRQEYIDGLSFYREQLPEIDIYFLENSSYDFESDQELTTFFSIKNIILIKFPVSNKFSEGKGFQEFEMLDNSIERLSSQYEIFVKITGRYKVLNIKKLLTQNLKYFIGDSHKKMAVTQTNIFITTGAFYKQYIKGLYLKVNDAEGRFIEHIVYNKIRDEKLFNQVDLFSENPLITGFSGSYGGTLNRNKYKLIIRNLERKMLRIFHIHRFLIEY